MNKKVWVSVICLCWLVLILYTCSKIIFGTEVAIFVTNEKLVTIGAFIDSALWLKTIVCYVTTWLTYFLYFGAVCQKWVLPKKQLCIVSAILVPMQILKVFVPEIGMQLDIVFMIFCPYFLKAKYKNVAIIFSVHYLGQLALLYTRSLPLLLINTNFLTQLVLSIDAYILLVIYYLYSNKYKEDNSMGQIMPPLFGKEDIKKQIAANNKKVTKLQEENKILEKTLNDNNETTDSNKN